MAVLRSRDTPWRRALGVELTWEAYRPKAQTNPTRSGWRSAMDSNHQFGLPYHAVTIHSETPASLKTHNNFNAHSACRTLRRRRARIPRGVSFAPVSNMPFRSWPPTSATFVHIAGRRLLRRGMTRIPRTAGAGAIEHCKPHALRSCRHLRKTGLSPTLTWPITYSPIPAKSLIVTTFYAIRVEASNISSLSTLRSKSTAARSSRR
jgi:hypothetical protein